MRKLFNNVARLFLAMALLPTVFLVGRVDGQAGGRLLFRWIRLFQRVNRGTETPRNKSSIDMLTFIALLKQKAPWEQLKPVIERREAMRIKVDSSSLAFSCYFIDGNFEAAYEVAHYWCEATKQQVKGDEDEMQRFFDEKGTDFSGRALSLIQNAMREERMAVWEANPQGLSRPNTMFDGMKDFGHILRYIQYYQAHLALGIMLWLQQRDFTLMHRAKSLADYRRTIGHLPRLSINETLARTLGMDEATLSEIVDPIIRPLQDR